jgi:DNA-binding MarR family transcriptional regulator
MIDALHEDEYRTLADIRFELRRFLKFSEHAARAAGLTTRQHQALLAIRAARSGGMVIRELADSMLLQPHTVTELVDRMEQARWVRREQDDEDARQVRVVLTDAGSSVLASLSSAHRSELRRLRPLLTALLAKL